MKKKWQLGAQEDMTKFDQEWLHDVIKRNIRRDKAAARVKKERKARPQQED
jgi:hypothetical protein